MKLNLLIFIVSCLSVWASAQPTDCFFSGESGRLANNNLNVRLSAGGFADDYDVAVFKIEDCGNRPVGLIFSLGWWLGGIDPGGNLQITASTYGNSNGKSGFSAGKFLAPDCQNWDKFWTVNGYEIRAHLADFNDNGKVEKPLPAIFGYPAKGNAHFKNVNGFDLPGDLPTLAPFFDKNTNGIYEPEKGEFPHPDGIEENMLTSKLTWRLVNGNSSKSETGSSIQLTLHFTEWQFESATDNVLNDAIFGSVAVINNGVERLDSISLGTWMDGDLGNFTDDFFGTKASLGTLYFYNSDNLDANGDQNTQGFGENPPALGLTFLNQNPSKTIYSNSNFITLTTPPAAPNEYFNFLNGHWRDGEPLTFGGTGYNFTSAPADFAFPDDPDNPSGWSMMNINAPPSDIRTLMSLKIGSLSPGEAAKKLDYAITYHRKPVANHLENVKYLFDRVKNLRDNYPSNLSKVTSNLVFCADTDCVWPGDSNRDGIVNHLDILPLGVGWGQVGKTRTGFDSWDPKFSENWNVKYNSDYDYKHLDADGSGEVDSCDWATVLNLYDESNFNYKPVDVFPVGNEFQLVPSPSSDPNQVKPGKLFVITIRLDTVPDLYGYAFSFEVDTSYFSQSIFTNQSVASNPLRVVRRTATQADFAAVYRDKVSKMKKGAISAMALSPKKLMANKPDSTKICLKNIKAIKSDGKEIPVGSQCLTLKWDKNSIATNEISIEKIKLYPNPNNGSFYFDKADNEISAVQISITSAS